MKMPATTAGVPLMAVTTVRTRRTPRPPTSLRKTAVAMARGTPMAAAMRTCSRVPTMAWRIPTWSRASGLAGSKVLLVLGEQRAPVDGGDGLDRHPQDDEDHQPEPRQGGADHQDGHHPVGGHLALDDLGGAEPGEGEEDQVPAQEARRPPTAASAGRRPPTPARRTRRRRGPAGDDVGAPEIAGPDRGGQAPRAWVARGGGTANFAR